MGGILVTRPAGPFVPCRVLRLKKGFLLPNSDEFFYQTRRASLLSSRNVKRLNISLPLCSDRYVPLRSSRASAYQIMCCLSSSCCSGELENKFRLFRQSGTWILLELADVSCKISRSYFEGLNSNISSCSEKTDDVFGFVSAVTLELQLKVLTEEEPSGYLKHLSLKKIKNSSLTEL